MTLTGQNKTKYSLEQTPIDSGGEGDIYRGFITKIIKVYKPGVVTQELTNKLKIMIKHPPSESVLSQVAWPLDIWECSPKDR